MADPDTGIERVSERDLPDLLPLLRAYCDFYRVAPSDRDLLAISSALIRDPEREGLQLIARDASGRALGFTTVYWSWSTLSASRIGVLNDLFVAPIARGTGLADALMEASRTACREHGAAQMTWQTARDNRRAQAVYERLGAQREEWVDYWLPTDSRSGTGCERGAMTAPSGGKRDAQPDLTVRQPQAGDAEAVGRLLHDFNTEFEDTTPGPRALAERVRELLAGGETKILLGGAGPDGVAVLRFRPAIFTKAFECYLAELYVAPDRRGHGLGRALMEAAIDLARREGADHMDLGTGEHDVAARALYERLGFSNREGRPDGPLNFFYEREL